MSDHAIIKLSGGTIRPIVLTTVATHFSLLIFLIQ